MHFCPQVLSHLCHFIYMHPHDLSLERRQHLLDRSFHFPEKGLLFHRVAIVRSHLPPIKAFHPRPADLAVLIDGDVSGSLRQHALSLRLVGEILSPEPAESILKRIFRRHAPSTPQPHECFCQKIINHLFSSSTIIRKEGGNVTQKKDALGRTTALGRPTK